MMFFLVQSFLLASLFISWPMVNVQISFPYGEDRPRNMRRPAALPAATHLIPALFVLFILIRRSPRTYSLRVAGRNLGGC